MMRLRRIQPDKRAYRQLGISRKSPIPRRQVNLECGNLWAKEVKDVKATVDTFKHHPEAVRKQFHVSIEGDET
jgi:hypothetical protein